MQGQYLLIFAATYVFQNVGSSTQDLNKTESDYEIKLKTRRAIAHATTAASFEYPTAEQQNNTEVIAQVGGIATIKCYTHFQGDETVTWLKKDEDHLLTAGGQVYSSESRYSVAHFKHQKLWELSVRDVRHSDAGLYECQITTHPPTSIFFILNVVEARAVIHGGEEVHVHTGVKLKLQCTVELATEPPHYIFWYHNDSMVNYAHSRPLLKVVGSPYSSTLIISNLTWEDAGNYICEAHKAHPDNMTLHVIAEEKHAALHKDNGKSDSGSASIISLNHYLLKIFQAFLWFAYTYSEECTYLLQRKFFR